MSSFNDGQELLRRAASLVDAEAAQTRAQIEAERSDGFNKLVLLAEFTALVKVGRALRSASGMSASGQDAKRLEAKPASPTAESGDARPRTVITPKQEGPSV